MKFQDLIVLTGLLHICSLTVQLNTGMFQNRLQVCYLLLSADVTGNACEFVLLILQEPEGHFSTTPTLISTIC